MDIRTIKGAGQPTWHLRKPAFGTHAACGTTITDPVYGEVGEPAEIACFLCRRAAARLAHAFLRPIGNRVRS